MDQLYWYYKTGPFLDGPLILELEGPINIQNFFQKVKLIKIFFYFLKFFTTMMIVIEYSNIYNNIKRTKFGPIVKFTKNF
jgi:hypothetical protein